MTELESRALELSEGKEPTASNIQRVAAQTSQEAASWAFSQWRLRAAAKRKFAKANEMLFTQDGLEMSSHEDVACYHASRFPQDAKVADLTVGIGADLIALAKRGPAIGFEIDPVLAEYAKHNIMVQGCEAEIIVGDCLLREWKTDFAFADPARRSSTKRNLDITDYQPSVQALAGRMSTLTLGCIKLSPMLQDDDLHNISANVEFVSHDGECKEALAVLGKNSKEGISAVRVETGESLVRTDTSSNIVPMPLDYFYEADPAAIRAHCLPTLCNQHNIGKLGDSNGYLTGDKLVSSTWLKTYRVIDSGSYDAKRVKESLILHSLSAIDVKQRGANADVASEAKSWRNPGFANAWVAIYPVGRSLKFAILVEATG